MKKLLFVLSIFAFACTKMSSKPQSPQHIKAFYRLKHIDKDGQVTYSKVVEVEEPIK